MRLHVLMAASVKTTIFWDVTLCREVKTDSNFETDYRITTMIDKFRKRI